MLVAIVWALVGCGSTDDVPTANPEQKPVGVPPDEGCGAGEVELADGQCLSAGIAADACGEGFAHDGLDGCDPILPDEPCGPGLMAIVGETACREVAPCEAGTWGAIPVEANTQHVDGSYLGGDADGSPAKPWPTVQAGINAAAPGAIVAIAAGSYVEHVLIQNKAVRLWGKCPSEVSLSGPLSQSFVVDIRAGADGSEVRDLAITGSGYGLAIAGSQDVAGDRLWIHDTSLPGWSVQNFGGSTSASLSRSLIESVVDIGVYGIGSSIRLSESVVRGTRALQETFGRGLSVSADPNTSTSSELTVERSVIIHNAEMVAYLTGSSAQFIDSFMGHAEPGTAPGGFATMGTGVVLWQQLDTGQTAHATIRGSVIERVSDYGVSVFDSGIDIETTVIRDVTPDVDGLEGMGVLASRSIVDLPVEASVRGSVVARTHTCGLCIAGMETLIESVVVRDVALQPAGNLIGRGISLEGSFGGEVPIEGSGAIVGSVVERANETGLALVFADALVESTWVRDIMPRGDGILGRGISVELDPVTGLGTVASLRHVRVERCHEFGIFVGGADATIENSHVLDILARPIDGAGGVGIAVQLSLELGTTSHATVIDTTVERCQQSGLSVIGSEVTFDGIEVVDSLPDGNGAFGDGLVASVAVLDGVVTPAPVRLLRSRIGPSPRAGLLAFSTDVEVADSLFECNEFHLNGEIFDGIPFAIVNDGGNTCGCNGSDVTCKVLSSNLEVPGPVGG
jgi:hypothetical protein